jgi:hypothetical protein
MSEPSRLYSGVQTGCLIAVALILLLFALGKCAQWSGVT